MNLPLENWILGDEVGSAASELGTVLDADAPKFREAHSHSYLRNNQVWIARAESTAPRLGIHEYREAAADRPKQDPSKCSLTWSARRQTARAAIEIESDVGDCPTVTLQDSFHGLPAPLPNLQQHASVVRKMICRLP